MYSKRYYIFCEDDVTDAVLIFFIMKKTACRMENHFTGCFPYTGIASRSSRLYL